MKFKLKNIKRNVMSKKVGWILLIVFIVSLITVKIITTARADNNKKELNILEIQPANSFTIKGSNNLTTTGIDTKDITSSDGTETFAVTIEHVSMPEFIGKIDQLNGKYDVIIIGRNKNNIATPYRDYSAITSGSEYTGGIKSSDGNNLLPTGNYAENDITKRKAEEIKEFIESGQLVYINNSIFTEKNKFQNSNLYKTFSYLHNDTSTEEVNNFVEFNYKSNTINENISLENILAKYLEKDKSSQKDIINKRPQIKVENTSGGDTETDYSNDNTTNDYVGTAKKRNMKFSVSIPDNVDDNFAVKLFLDINGDGVFTEDECYRKLTNVPAQQTYNLSYNIGTQFIGWLGWKVEIENYSGVKSYTTGNVFFKKLTLDDIKQVKVLQVSPSSGLDLKNDTKFKTMLQNFNKKKDYNLNITKITADEFNSDYGMTKGKLKLNGFYDMVIIGFSDSYNSKDIKGDALDALQDFVKSGQSVMFTHDTMALRMESPGSASVNLTTRFRDFVGQSRFIDKYRLDGEKTDAYQEYDSDTETYKDRVIPHSDLLDRDGNLLTTNNSIVGYALNGRKNITHTTQVYKTNEGLINDFPYKLGDISVALTHNQWYQLDLEDPDVVPWYNLKYDGKTKSDYYKAANGSASEVKSGSYLNQYDSRNNYYTYSKGNITYSGTGHSSGYTDDEFKLFINTMIKAERGANHKPDVICNIPNEYDKDDDSTVNLVPEKSDYSFTVDANDLDKDKVNVDVKVDGKVLTSENVNMSNLNSDGLFEVNTQHVNRSPLTVTIPSEKLTKGRDDVTVVIKATDIQGAESEVKTYKIRPVEMPKFNVTADLDKNSLKRVDSSGNLLNSVVNGTTVEVKPGENVNVSYNVKPESLLYGDVKECDYKEVAILIDDSLSQNTWTYFRNGLDNLALKLLDGGDIRFDLITFGKNGAREENADQESTDKAKLHYIMVDKNLNGHIAQASSDNKKINDALDKSISFFNNSNYNWPSSTTSKNIIILSKGNVEAINDETKSLIKDNYNVITVQISDGYDSESLDLKSIHNILGGLSPDYYLCKPDNAGQENYNSAGSIITNISNNISRMKYKTYILDNVEVDFNLGDEINLVDGLEQSEINTNKYNKILPKIKYLVDIDEDGNVKTNDGKLVYNGYFMDTIQQSLTYMKSYPVNFKITSAEDAHGLCEFSTPNEVKYRYYGSNSYGSTHIDYTPSLQLDEITVDHGVYNKIQDGKAQYLDKSNWNFVDGSVATFAANINNLYDSNTDLLLSIDPNCKMVAVPTIYKVINENVLEKLTDTNGNNLTFNLSGDNNYEFKNFDGLNNNNIIVLYSVKFKGFSDKTKKYKYTNTISVMAGTNRIFSEANVYRLTGAELPDLF